MLKGWVGEFQVNIAAKLFLSVKDYHLIRNVTIPTEDGSTQIDHVIVSRFGVFVVETKNLHGWIYGSERDSMWTLKLFKTTHKFQNPLRQNYKHTKTLADLLEIPDNKIKSVIVFVGNSTFKTPMPENVTETGGYIRYIKQHRREILSEAEVKTIIARIAENRLTPNLRTHRQHVQHVRQIVEQKGKQATPNRDGRFERICKPPAIPSKATPLYCPRCGKPMILRTSRKGAGQGQQFWGCTGFPQCRETRKFGTEN